MPRANPLPVVHLEIAYKSNILTELQQIDQDDAARARVLQMETGFRQKAQILGANLPTGQSLFRSFNTSPFVLMLYSSTRSYREVYQLDGDILDAKVFSSVETSAGRMVEQVALPPYGWSTVASAMSTATSVIDGERITPSGADFVTLKSAGNCINDSMAKNIGWDIADHYAQWATDANRTNITVTLGYLYGTYARSNKKGWHMMNRLRERLESNGVVMDVPPDGRWNCSFTHEGITVTVAVLMGKALWEALTGRPLAYLEICVALVRACITPTTTPTTTPPFSIPDLQSIVSTAIVPPTYNVSILQLGQLEWLFLVLSHYCDRLDNL